MLVNHGATKWFGHGGTQIGNSLSTHQAPAMKPLCMSKIKEIDQLLLEPLLTKESCHLIRKQIFQNFDQECFDLCRRYDTLLTFIQALSTKNY